MTKTTAKESAGGPTGPPKAAPAAAAIGGGSAAPSTALTPGVGGLELTPSRKSLRHRSTPTRFVARPSRQGLGVEEGDMVFLASGATMDQPRIKAEEPARKSRRLMDREGEGIVPSGEGVDGPGSGMGTRRSARLGTPMDTAAAGRKRPPPAAAAASGSSAAASPPRPRKRQPVGSGAPRPPRVIVIGAGISGLACARELSERRHDVLVLEARNRIGGRLRTIDLMLDKEWQDEGETPSDLCKVRNWSPVDVGGAFIHGTGVNTSEFASSSHVDSHDFGTSSGGRAGKKRSAEKQQEQQKGPVRKSERGHSGPKQPYKPNNDDKITYGKRAEDGIGSLNPVYVLARQKMRLPVHAAEGAYTCLVDHEGNLVSEEVDQIVAEEFNEVLDLATDCCNEGRYPWKESGTTTTTKIPATKSTDNNKQTQEAMMTDKRLSAGDVTRSPNYVSDDTAANGSSTSSSAAAPVVSKGGNTAAQDSASIDPLTDFGTIFEECKQYHKQNSTAGQGGNQRLIAASEEVRSNLFNWHVANLEMSSGAPMSKLGQRWNDDEPFGYGGDHSYLEGGLRDIIEALAEGFECRGVGDRNVIGTGGGYGNEVLRRSGDFTSLFSGRSNVPNYSDPLGTATPSRGVIQCGIEVTGIKIVEKEEVKLLRKQRRPQPVQVNVSSVRRSSRENRGSKMTSYLDALSSRSKGEQKLPADEPAASADPTAPTSSYGNNHNTVVHVTTKCGLTLEADAVIVTMPLAILSIPRGMSGHISFSPPLPAVKRNALNRLGVGAYNKCCMSFEKPFWNNLPRHLGSSASMPAGTWNDEETQRFDFIGHASAEHGKDILFFNIRDVPILVAIYGGSDYSNKIEGMHDEAVVFECMQVLKKICAKAIKKRDSSLRTRQQLDLTIPNWPIDFFVSRWGSDPYSRGAFSYVPKGVNGFEELRNMSRPICDFRPEWVEETDKSPKRPLIMFAGEATTPYHPSTIHGAFETGIREAYRLDLALEPDLNTGIVFEESYLYQPTFSVRRAQTDPNQTSLKSAAVYTSRSAGNEKDTAARSWWFDHDASILRGIETCGASTRTLSLIKKMILAPASDTHSVEEMKGRYQSLLRMIAPSGEAKPIAEAENEWKLPGRRGTWLAAQNLLGNMKSDEPAEEDAGVKPTLDESTVSDDPRTRKSSRRVQKKVDESFTFY